MPEAAELLQGLLRAQNVDGGWSYRKGSSWTEPTAFALLALGLCSRLGLHRNATCYNTGTSAARASTWLRHHQRSDGGWPPHPSVEVSTSVSSLALLALPDDTLAPDRRRQAVDWILQQIKPEPGPASRFVLGIARLPQQQPPGGSPWFPATAAWIGPTALSAISLSAAAHRDDDPKLLPAVQKAKQYLLATRCNDHGWNHGGSKFRSQNAESYPEMTGLALLALDGVPASELNRSLDRAEAFLPAPGSSEALSWLQLGLVRHGRNASNAATGFPCRTTREVALRLLALARWAP